MAEGPVLLATGATGLVMSHVVRCWLEAHPEGRAVAVDLNPPDPVVAAFFEPVSARLEVRPGDVRDPALWDGIGRDFTVSHVVHGISLARTKNDGRRSSNKQASHLQLSTNI